MGRDTETYRGRDRKRDREGGMERFSWFMHIQHIKLISEPVTLNGISVRRKKRNKGEQDRKKDREGTRQRERG